MTRDRPRRREALSSGSSRVDGAFQLLHPLHPLQSSKALPFSEVNPILMPSSAGRWDIRIVLPTFIVRKFLRRATENLQKRQPIKSINQSINQHSRNKTRQSSNRAITQGLQWIDWCSPNTLPIRIPPLSLLLGARDLKTIKKIQLTKICKPKWYCTTTSKKSQFFCFLFSTCCWTSPNTTAYPARGTR